MLQHWGTKSAYNSKETPPLLFMDWESKGEDIDLADNFLGKFHIDSGSDFEPNEEDIESSDGEERSAVQRRRRSYFISLNSDVIN